MLKNKVEISMENIKIKADIIPELVDILNLYNDVKWIAYTKYPDQLKRAINNSLKVWTAWDKNKLVGLARVVGDATTIIYIQDILVLTSYQGKGIGTKLLQLILKNYQSVRQIILLTDNTEKTIAFYEKNGLSNISKSNGVAFMK